MKIILIIFLLTTLITKAGLTNIYRETFQGLGTNTAASPGNLQTVAQGSFHHRANGPRITGDTSAGGQGWSADMRIQPGDLPREHIFNVNSNAALTLGIFTAWYYIGAQVSQSTADGELMETKQNNTNPILKLGMEGGQTNFHVQINGIWTWDNTGVAIPLMRWFELRHAWSRVSGNTHDYVVAYRLAQVSTWVTIVSNRYTFAGTVDYARGGNIAGAGSGSTYISKSRYGMPSLYTMASFSECLALVPDVVDPPAVQTVFVNPATGSDTNTGAVPGEAWATAGKITTESAFSGLLPAASYSVGNTLVIDTSAALLDVSATNLTFATGGLNVKATNAPYWTNLLCVTLTNAHFTATGPANVYQITTFNNAGFGQSNIVVWEDDKWMTHHAGATWASVSNSVCTNAGSFWTDGATIYVHPFGNTAPASDGKAYTRSVARSTDGFGSAINLQGNSMNFRDCYAGKTAMSKRTDSTDGLASYVIAGGNGLGGTSIIANCYLYYGSKHIIGLVGDADDSDITIMDVQAEQGGRVSQSPFVSFMAGATKKNNLHRYVRCVTLKDTGKLGSTQGENGNQSVMLMHNSGSGTQFREVIFDSCVMNGTVGWGITTNALVTNCVFGGVQPSALGTNLIVNSRFTGVGLDMQYNGASNTVVRNCVAVQTNVLSGGIWTGWALQGSNVVIENCTVDFSGISSPSPGQSTGLLRRNGRIGLTFRNNVIVMGTNVYSVFHGFTTNDSYSISNNIYQLASAVNFSALYTNGATGIDRTLAQWQALGFDANSKTTNNLRLRHDYRPMPGSPVIDFGVNLGPARDATGRYFTNRNDAGPYEYWPLGGMVLSGASQ